MYRVLYLVLLGVSFWLGMKFQEFRYDDLCLDLGGGKNPGNHPICVLQR